MLVTPNQSLTKTLDKLNEIAGSPDIWSPPGVVDRQGNYRGGAYAGDTTPPVQWQRAGVVVRNSDFTPCVNVENLKVVDCFTQEGKHVLMDTGTGSYSAYLLDSQGMAIERLNREFYSPAHFEKEKSHFFCPAAISGT